MSKKKIKKCSYYSLESWKTKKQQKKDIDKKKEAEAYEALIKAWGGFGIRRQTMSDTKPTIPKTEATTIYKVGQKQWEVSYTYDLDKQFYLTVNQKLRRS